MKKTKSSQNKRWQPDLYDSGHQFVSGYGKDLLKLLAVRHNEHILDLGCGTGDLAQNLYESGAQVLGIDRSPEMIGKAKKKYPHLDLRVADAVSFRHTESFDAVFSNATLHWISEPLKLLQNANSLLKDGGRFVAEFGGAGNIQIIEQNLRKILNESGYSCPDSPWFFPTIGEYTSLMEQAGFYVTYAEHFQRLTELDGSDGLRNWLRMFAMHYLSLLTDSEQNKIITSVEEKLKTCLLFDGKWHADYMRIRVKGYKKNLFKNI